MNKLTTKGIAIAFAVACATTARAGLWDEALPGLGADDQARLVRTINYALTNYTASTKEKTIESIYKVNRDMVKSVSARDRKSILAEVFATIPEIALPALADGLAKEVINRKALGLKPDDDSYTDFAVSAQNRIYRRCRDFDFSGQRRTVFAAIMLIKGSEGDPEDLRQQLEPFIPESVRKIARDEWIPAALGEKDEPPTYEPLIEASTNDFAFSNAEILPEQLPLTLTMPSPVHADALVDDALLRDHSKNVIAPKFDDVMEVGMIGQDAGLTVMPWNTRVEDGKVEASHAGSGNRRPHPTPYGRQSGRISSSWNTGDAQTGGNFCGCGIWTTKR